MIIVNITWRRTEIIKEVQRPPPATKIWRQKLYLNRCFKNHQAIVSSIRNLKLHSDHHHHQRFVAHQNMRSRRHFIRRRRNNGVVAASFAAASASPSQLSSSSLSSPSPSSSFITARDSPSYVSPPSASAISTFPVENPATVYRT